MKKKKKKKISPSIQKEMRTPNGLQKHYDHILFYKSWIANSKNGSTV